MNRFNQQSLAFDPLLPWPVLALLGLAACLVFGLYLRRRGRAPVLRFLGLCCLTLALTGPSRLSEERLPLPDVVAVLVDRSESMALSGRLAGAEQALTRIKSDLGRIAGLDLRLGTLSDGPDGTNISSSLDQLLADTPSERIAGAIVITDGQISDAASAGRPFPVHQILIGSPRERDRRIVIRSAPRTSPIGTLARVVIRVDDTDARVPISVRIGDNDPFTQEVDTGRDIALEIPIERRGAIPIAMEVDAARDEVSVANNAIAVSISGVRDRLRVLLVTGEPHAGARAWRNLLKSDPSVDLVQFTILRSPEKQDFTPVEELSLIPFPTRELFLEKISSFDLVVFDRFKQLVVLPNAYLESVAQWVEDGGAFLMLAGPADGLGNGAFATPLSRVIPAQPQGAPRDGPFKPVLTERGLNHPVSSGLAPQADSWGKWLRVQPGTAQGDVLLEGAGQPLLILSQMGKGRAAAVMSDQAWLWRRGYDGGGPFDEIFRRTAHWLMKEADLEADRLILRARKGQLLVERQMAADPGPARLSSAAGARDLPLQASGSPSWRGELAVTTPGLFVVSSGDKRGFIIAGIGNPAEAQALTATGDPVSTVQARPGNGGGAVHFVGRTGQGSLPQVTRIGANQVARGQSLALRQAFASRVTTMRRTQLLPSWVWLAGVFVLGLAAWWREGR